MNSHVEHYEPGKLNEQGRLVLRLYIADHFVNYNPISGLLCLHYYH